MTPDIIRLRGLRADLACLGAGTLCTVTERRLAVYALAAEATTLRREIELPFVATELHIGGGDRWLLVIAVGRQRGWIVDLADGGQPIEIETTDARPVITGTFARLGALDVALVERRRGHLDVYRLDTGTWDASISFASFRFARLVAIGDAARVVAVGHWDGDYRDVLGVIDPTRRDDRAVEQLHRTHGIMDESEQLCVGPCGSDAFVAFRDTDGDEDPDDPPADDDCRIPFWGLRGAYIRRLDGTIIQQIELEPTWKGCEPAAGGPRTLAFGGKDMIHLVDRATEQIAAVAGRWLAASSDGARVLAERYGELAILEL